MKKLKVPTTFILGLTFSFLAVVIAWYWYKSTSAEDGALDLLDRMAETEMRFRQAQAATSHEEVVPARYISLERNGTVHVQTAVSPDDLERVKGIGPVFAARLQAAGIHTLEQLLRQNPAQLAVIMDVYEWRAEAILAEARRLV